MKFMVTCGRFFPSDAIGIEIIWSRFGTYYRIKALKAIVKSQESAAPSNRPESAVVKAKNTPVSEYTSPLAGKWKSWILTVLLFAAMELAYRVQLRCRQSAPGGSEGRKRSEVGFDEEDELEDDLSESEECNDEDEWSEESDRPLVRPLTCRGNENSSGGRVYVAMYDYESPEREGYIGFRAGDRFLIDDYTESGWCHAVRAAEGAEEGRRGLVPGNFLRLFERETKL
uniref:Uncharacterized protein TCIL3000_10_12590 n=1 Tax=Trypanosoma congolense (strain IL3000) TaxID=1068625 RepID=G0UYL0_TRYCI|nr:unnamed protein product [Trypanosoma congolense IL3000]